MKRIKKKTTEIARDIYLKSKNYARIKYYRYLEFKIQHKIIVYTVTKSTK